MNSVSCPPLAAPQRLASGRTGAIPASIIRLGKSTSYMSEAMAKPFGSWRYGQRMGDL